MEKAVQHTRVVRFATFEVDLQAGELRKAGLKLKFSGQPFQVLAILLEQPGAIVTREELQKRLWPDTFVDVDHNLNTAINKIRQALGDSAENPRFVETLPRRGYRFIAPIDGAVSAELPEKVSEDSRHKSGVRFWAMRWWILVVLVVLLSSGGFLFYKTQHLGGRPVQRALTRLTFDDGLQIGATWSPDGRFIAYSSNRGGKFDIWVQQVSGGDPVQITKGHGHNWQPDWSPDGKYIAYRSEAGQGGLYVVPALGGAGLERKITSFGYRPRWSPDSAQILFDTNFGLIYADRFYVVALEVGEPREVLADFLSSHVSQLKRPAVSATWHPDGKRVSIRVINSVPPQTPSILTIPIGGGPATELEIAQDVTEQLKVISLAAQSWNGAGDFSWAPSGSAIYYESTFRGVQNIWRMNVDPRSSRAVAVERLTTGPGADLSLSLSRDGKKLAFTGESLHIRPWLFPFDATRGRVTGAGHPLTTHEGYAWRHSLSRDGKKLAFEYDDSGKFQIWEKSLVDQREDPVVADSYARLSPEWSVDGLRLAYLRTNLTTGEAQLMIWSSQSRTEEPVTPPALPYDWSPDSASLLATRRNRDSGRSEIWWVPLVPSSHAQTAARKLIFNPAYDLWQPHFSPDGQWIVFEAAQNSAPTLQSNIYVTSASGGPWIRISSGQWDDKPSWSPDGKAIYYISLQEGVFNVWGIHFDPAKGKRVGEPFRVTSFEFSGPMIPSSLIAGVDLSLTEDKLVLTMEERSGSIWMLDNVDR